MCIFDVVDKRRMSSTISALSSIARLSIGMTMSVPSQLCVSADDASAITPSEGSSYLYPPPTFQSVDYPVLDYERFPSGLDPVSRLYSPE